MQSPWTLSPTPMLTCGQLCLDTGARRLHGPAGDVVLTKSVFTVLRCLMAHPGRVVLFDELIGVCWPAPDGGPDDATHAAHQRVREARAAVKAAGGSGQAIRNRSGIGYVMEGERRQARIVTPAEAQMLDTMHCAILAQE